MKVTLNGYDWAAIGVYLAIIIGIGCWAGIRQRRSQGKAQSREYFLAGGHLNWVVIGLALFSTNISTVHLVSLAEEGFKNGLACGNFEWMAPFTLIILSLFFAPFYIKTRVTTLPDFLEMRYSRGCRNWLAVMSMLAAVVIHISFALYAGAVVLQGLFGVPLVWSLVGGAIFLGYSAGAGFDLRGELARIRRGAGEDVVGQRRPSRAAGEPVDVAVADVGADFVGARVASPQPDATAGTTNVWRFDAAHGPGW